MESNWLLLLPLSGLCKENHSIIRVVYGKSRICYQGHVRIGRTLYHGARLWNDCYATIIVERFIMERFIMERFIVERFIMER